MLSPTLKLTPFFVLCLALAWGCEAGDDEQPNPPGPQGDDDDTGDDDDAADDDTTGDDDTEGDDDATGDDDTEGDDDATGDDDTDDPYGPDPSVQIDLMSGTITDCLPGFLSGGARGAYSGFAGSSFGAYVVWKDAWSGSTLNLRLESWDNWGGPTGPGVYTVTQADTNYADCGLCLFSENDEGTQFWPSPGDTVDFTSWDTGTDGIGTTLSGTYSGTLSDDFCSGTAVISFSGLARNMDYGPL